jgi:ribonucleotide monophosphatase NagD (HAD superfamily)
MRRLTGFAPLAEAYDGFIIDLWGVIHDGVTPYDGAVDCLRRLRALGKPSILLSNAPRRSGVAQIGMRAMGITDDLYTDILTSGEQTFRMLRDRDDPFFAGLGRTLFHIGPERDRNVFDTLDFFAVERPEAARFVLNTGLPMICANPDLEVIRGGRRVICAGLLTQRYEARGGIARWIGKPDPAIYGPVLKMLGLPKNRVLAVGDALRTDIAGAQTAGVASCWVLGGIHGAELAGDPARVESALRDAGLSPDATLPAFVW